MREFRLIELLTYYCWPFIDIRLHCSGNFKLKKPLHCDLSVALFFSK
jgi:hypothetical protein